MDELNLAQVKDLLSVLAGTLTLLSVVVAATSARGRLIKRQAALSELLDRQDLSASARAALTERRDRAVAKIIASEHVSPVHLTLVGVVSLFLLSLMGGTGYHAGGTSVAADLWDPVAGGTTWSNLIIAVPGLLMTAGVINVFVHLILEKHRVEDEVRGGVIPEGLRPRPRQVPLATFVLTVAIPMMVFGASATAAANPDSVIPQGVSVLILVLSFMVALFALATQFDERLPAYLREEPKTFAYPGQSSSDELRKSASGKTDQSEDREGV